MINIIRWVGNNHIKPAIVLEHLSKNGSKIKIHLIAQRFQRTGVTAVDLGVNLLFKLLLARGVRFVEMVADQPLNLLPATRLVLVRKANQRIAAHYFVIEVGQRLNLADVLLVHNQRQPEAQFGNLHRAGVNVHAIQGMFNAGAFEGVGRPSQT